MVYGGLRRFYPAPFHFLWVLTRTHSVESAKDSFVFLRPRLEPSQEAPNISFIRFSNTTLLSADGHTCTNHTVFYR